MKSTKISSLFPKRGNRNVIRTEKTPTKNNNKKKQQTNKQKQNKKQHKNKITQGKT